MLALHNECLNRCYLFGRLNLLEGLLGFGFGVLHALEGLSMLGLLRLRVTLQGLVFFDEILELLLDLIDPGLLLLALDAPWPLCLWPRPAPSLGLPLRSWPL